MHVPVKTEETLGLCEEEIPSDEHRKQKWPPEQVPPLTQLAPLLADFA